MPTFISVTKKASAYIELEEDTITSLDAEQISNIVAIDEKIGIGSAVVFLLDGSNLNVKETADQINEMLSDNRNGYFQEGFSEN